MTQQKIESRLINPLRPTMVQLRIEVSPDYGTVGTRFIFSQLRSLTKCFGGELCFITAIGFQPEGCGFYGCVIDSTFCPTALFVTHFLISATAVMMGS